MHSHLMGSCLPELELIYGTAENIHTKIHLSSSLTAIPEKFPDLWSVNDWKFGGARNRVPKFTHQKVLLQQW